MDKTIEEMIEAMIEEELMNELNTLASGNIVGYIGPLGMDTKAIHKGFWRDKSGKKVKTDSPSVK